MRNYLTHKVNDLYSVIDSTRIIVNLVPRNVAAAALNVMGESEALLDSPAPDDQWRSTYLSAVANEIDALKVDAADQSKVEAVNARIDKLGKYLNTLRDQFQRELYRAELRDLEQQLEAKAVKSIAAMAAAGFPGADAAVWEMLMGEGIGQRVLQLRELLNDKR